jgi:translation initiation factor 2 subunit 1
VSIGKKLMKEYDSIHEAFVETAYEGYEVLVKIVGEDFAKEMAEIARENIKPTRVKVRGYFELRCLAPDGIERIKKALMEAYKVVKKKQDVKVDVEYVGAPRYRIVLEAEDYKVAEKTLKSITDKVLKTIKKFGGDGSFVRESI